MRVIQNLFRRREIDAWRVAHTERAEKNLSQLACDLIVTSETSLQAANWKDGLIAPSDFIHKHVAPLVRTNAKWVVLQLVKDANAELLAITEYSTVWNDRPNLEQRPGDFAGLGDVAVAAGSIGGGIAIATALPAAAVTTTGGLLGTGLFASTVVSWPAVLIGGTFATILVATGTLNASRISAKARDRLRRRTNEYIYARLLRGPSGQPAIFEQVADLLAKAADDAKKLS